MLVVPAMVVGAHETLRKLDRAGRLGPLATSSDT
jgi:hypothetical protein